MEPFDLLYLAAATGYVLWLACVCGFVSERLLPALERAFRWRRWYRNLYEGGNDMTVSKRLTSKSGLTIPKQVRGEAGFMPGMAVDIETVEDGVLIRKRVPTCRFCGGVHGVVNVRGMEMCGECAAAIRKELEKVGA